MRIKLYLVPIILFALLFSATAEDVKHHSVKAIKGEGTYALLKKYKVNTSSCNLDYFKTINKLDSDLMLMADKSYQLPILVYTYNATSIRSTIGINDWDLAKKIQSYNEAVHKAGLKENDYRVDNVLWVPYDILHCKGELITTEENTNSDGKTITYPLFGKEHEVVDIVDTKLKGRVYYIVAGHGGPDPGAMVKNGEHTLCEDEYAYDISLRLARNLMQHNATVYMITEDKNDGIRSGEYLKMDKDETCYPNQVIPLNQVKRLDQRVDAINELYNKHKKQGATKQRAVVIHVDSRSSSQRIDMFFYHNPKSTKGKELATQLRNTIDAKYAMHQKGRGYSGTVKSRNLHMLRKTYPVSVYIELGNIKNYRDQKRFIVEDNRQAGANWLAEGLMNEK
ncbi:MAG: N-acetylmuramoyl-L-alanine amidase [Bacteroidales bacterium]